jgi:hypothetical protein
MAVFLGVDAVIALYNRCKFNSRLLLLLFFCSSQTSRSSTVIVLSLIYFKSLRCKLRTWRQQYIEKSDLRHVQLHVYGSKQFPTSSTGASSY